MRFPAADHDHGGNCQQKFHNGQEPWAEPDVEICHGMKVGRLKFTIEDVPLTNAQEEQKDGNPKRSRALLCEVTSR